MTDTVYLDAAVSATDDIRSHDRVREGLLTIRDNAIREAIDHGHTITELVHATKLSRSQLERVRDARPRSGNRKPATKTSRQIDAQPRTTVSEGQSNREAVSEPSQARQHDEGDFERVPFDPGA